METAGMTATLLGVSFRSAQHIISQVRNVRFDDHGRWNRSMTGPWIGELLNDGASSAAIPAGYSCKVTSPG